MTNDTDWPMLKVQLNAWEASKTAEILTNLAALIDANDPDGLRDAYGRRADEHLLPDLQFMLLKYPLYNKGDRAEVAADLRRISARIEGQLPPDAPEIGRRRLPPGR
jgi:hypothetical protein